MKAIWKYRLDITGRQEIHFPLGPVELLTVQMQYDELTLWAVVEPDVVEIQSRWFCVHGTGSKFPQDHLHRYIGTVQDSGGLVWHVFELQTP